MFFFLDVPRALSQVTKERNVRVKLNCTRTGAASEKTAPIALSGLIQPTKEATSTGNMQ